MKLLDRLKVCWYVLSRKEYYCIVILKRYKVGTPMVAVHCANVPTKTAIKKLIEALKDKLKYETYGKTNKGY